MVTESERCQTEQSGFRARLLPGDTWRAFLIRLRYLLLVPIGSLSYIVINRLTVYRTDPVIFAFPFDPDLPFVPSFVYIYITYHLFVAAVLFAHVFYPERFSDQKRYVTALFATALTAAVIFLVMPTHVPRPDVSGESLTLRLMQQLYANDQPFNCFPSLHVTWTFITCFYLQKMIGHRWLATLMSWIYFILICLSTVLIRQHYTPDIIGGLVLGSAAVVLTDRRITKRGQA